MAEILDQMDLILGILSGLGWVFSTLRPFFKKSPNQSNTPQDSVREVTKTTIQSHRSANTWILSLWDVFLLMVAFGLFMLINPHTNLIDRIGMALFYSGSTFVVWRLFKLTLESIILVVLVREIEYEGCSTRAIVKKVQYRSLGDAINIAVVSIPLYCTGLVILVLAAKTFLSGLIPALLTVILFRCFAITFILSIGVGICIYKLDENTHFSEKILARDNIKVIRSGVGYYFALVPLALGFIIMKNPVVDTRIVSTVAVFFQESPSFNYVEEINRSRNYRQYCVQTEQQTLGGGNSFFVAVDFRGIEATEATSVAEWLSYGCAERETLTISDSRPQYISFEQDTLSVESPNMYEIAPSREMVKNVLFEYTYVFDLTKPTGYAGVLIHAVNDTHLLFDIDNDGFYRIRKLNQGVRSELVNASDISHIVKKNEANKISINAQHGRYTFFVNDTFVTSITDKSNTSGFLGLVAGSKSVGGTTVKFTNMRVISLDGE